MKTSPEKTSGGGEGGDGDDGHSGRCEVEEDERGSVVQLFSGQIAELAIANRGNAFVEDGRP